MVDIPKLSMSFSLHDRTAPNFVIGTGGRIVDGQGELAPVICRCAPMDARTSGSSPLYHYTRLESFCNIVKSGELWLRPLDCMADWSDGHNLLDLIRHRADLRYRSLDQRLLRVIHEQLENFKREEVFAICFTGGMESILHWRGYAKAHGVAIGLARELFDEGLAHLEGARLAPVEYDQRVRVDTADFVLDAIQKAYWSSSSRDRRKFRFPDAASEVISAAMPFLKHSFYADEREWRFILRGDAVPTTMAMIGGVASRVKKVTWRGASLLHFEIERLMLAPTIEKNAALERAKGILDENGVSYGFIQASMVPERL